MVHCVSTVSFKARLDDIMSATGADLIYLSTTNFYVLAIGGLIGIFFTTLKVLFGSYYLPTVLRSYETGKNIETTYDKMFRTRENYCYHIAAARSRGESEEARRLAKDLMQFDKEIDKFEERHFKKNNTSSRGASKV